MIRNWWIYRSETFVGLYPQQDGVWCKVTTALLTRENITRVNGCMQFRLCAQICTHRMLHLLQWKLNVVMQQHRKMHRFQKHFVILNRITKVMHLVMFTSTCTLLKFLKIYEKNKSAPTQQHSLFVFQKLLDFINDRK